MIVQHSRQQIVRRSDRMEISGKMEIQVIHRYNLCISASGCSAFNTKARPERRLTQCDQRFFIHFRHRLSQTDSRCRLSLSCGCRIDSCDKDQFSVLVVFDLLPQIIRKFCFILSIEFQVILLDPYCCSDISDVLQFRFLCDFNICFHDASSSFLL